MTSPSFLHSKFWDLMLDIKTSQLEMKGDGMTALSLRSYHHLSSHSRNLQMRKRMGTDEAKGIHVSNRFPPASWFYCLVSFSPFTHSFTHPYNPNICRRNPKKQIKEKEMKRKSSEARELDCRQASILGLCHSFASFVPQFHPTTILCCR